MFHILICDDEPVTCTFIEDVLSGYAQKNEISMNIEIFYTGEGLCEYVDRKSGVDLLFLDIELPDVNGAEIGKTLRENIGNETIQIIFISGKERYAMQLFKARPFDFLIKPLNANMVIDVFENYRKVYKQSRSYFEYKIGKSTEKISALEIMYCMCDQRKICIVTGKEKKYFYGNMKELHKGLSLEGFWSVHFSYIINVRYAKQFGKSEIIMCDGSRIPVSNVYKKEIAEKIMRLDGGRSGG